MSDPIDIPLKSGRDHRVNSWDIVSYQATYKDINVEREFQKMRQWCLANPRNRKTEAGVKRFIVAWLNRANPEPTSGQAAYRERVDAEFERELERRQPATPERALAAIREARAALGMQH